MRWKTADRPLRGHRSWRHPASALQGVAGGRRGQALREEKAKQTGTAIYRAPAHAVYATSSIAARHILFSENQTSKQVPALPGARLAHCGVGMPTLGGNDLGHALRRQLSICPPAMWTAGRAQAEGAAASMPPGRPCTSSSAGGSAGLPLPHARTSSETPRLARYPQQSHAIRSTWETKAGRADLMATWPPRSTRTASQPGRN